MINVRSGGGKAYHINILISKLILIGLVSKVDAIAKYLVPVETLFRKSFRQHFLREYWSRGGGGEGGGEITEYGREKPRKVIVFKTGSGEVDR